MTEEADAPSSKDEVEASQELSGRQRSLYEALADKSDDLAAMYQGALQVLQSPSTVDRFAMAAHNLREVMEKLPRYIDVPKKESFNLKEAVFELEHQLEDVQEKSDSYDGEEWDGEIENSLSGFLESVELMFARNREHNPKKRERYEEMLGRLDPSATSVSERKRERLFDEWKELRGFFLGVCHHGRETDIDEFTEYLERLERHMLARLRPQTFKTQDTLDKIINEAEGNG